MISTLLATVIVAQLTPSAVPPLHVVAKHNGTGIEVRWFPPPPTERVDRWAYRVERVDSAGVTLPITHAPLQVVLNVATLRDRLGSFAETYLGTVARTATAQRINENTVNEALADPVTRSVLVRSAVLYPEVADILGWRRIDQDLQPGKTYTYRVIVVDRAARDAEHLLGSARAVAARSSTTGPRSATVSQPAPDRLEVTWSRDTAREQAEGILRYAIHRREGGGPWTTLDPGLVSPLRASSGPVGSYVDTHVLAGRTYQYAVTAVDLTGAESRQTSTGAITVSDQRAPPPPLDVEIAGGFGALAISWLTAGLPDDVVQFEVLKVRRPRPEGGPRGVIKVVGKVKSKVGSLNLKNPGLGRHEYAVRSVDRAGNRGPLSVTVGVDVDRQVRLKTPSGVRAELTDNGQIEIAWRPTFGTDAVGYVVQRSVLGSADPPTRISPATLGVRDKVFLDTAPPLDGPPLAYRLIAVDAASAQSVPSPWVALPDLRRAPAVSLEFARRGESAVHLNWQVAPSAVATGFRVQVQVDRGRWANLPGKALAADTRAHVDAVRRAPESLVRYRVVSLGGAAGPPILSNVATVRHDSASLATPSAPTAHCLAQGVEIRWSAAPGASSYEIQRALGMADFAPRVDVSGTSWTDRSVAVGKRVQYRLVARHGLSDSRVGESVSIVCSAR